MSFESLGFCFEVCVKAISGNSDQRFRTHGSVQKTLNSKPKTQNLHNLQRAVWQGPQKGLAVSLAQYPIIQNNDDTFVIFCSNQAADTLSQFQDRFRERIFREWITAIRL